MTMMTIILRIKFKKGGRGRGRAEMNEFTNKLSVCIPPPSPPQPHIPSRPSRPPVLAHKRIIVWKDGVPMVQCATQQIKEIIPDVLVSALMEPYVDELGIYPEYTGLTNLEVMAKNMAAHAALGGVDTVNQMLDRILGKPKQTSESKNLNVNYQDFLDEIARRGGSDQ